MKYYIDFKIKNNEEEYSKNNVEAKYDKQNLKFNYDDENIKINIKNKENIIMQKENKDSSIIFNFKLNKKTTTKYYLNDLNFYIDTEVLTNKLNIDDNLIYVEYDLWLSGENVGSFKYEINIKEAAND